MDADKHPQGKLLQADFFENSGGLNLTDSPIRVDDGQATGGANYTYALTGGFNKRRGHSLFNSSADAQTRHLGSFLRAAYDGSKSTFRAAGRKLQKLDLTAITFTNLSEDTLTATTDAIAASQTLPYITAQFNSSASQVVWGAGSGVTSLLGVYSDTKFTKNGSASPTGIVTAVVAALTGVWAATGTYYYSFVLRKASTQALSNAALDVVAVVANTTDKVTLSFAGLTGLDTTKYDQIWIYRSSVAGVSGFTAGSIVAKVASSTATYVDTGTSLLDAQVVPRSGNIVLDNSTLPSGTPISVAMWKRRLVTAIDSTVYISDLNKPESWPATNPIIIPSGGPVTAIASIMFNSSGAADADEWLAVFKETELWIITGDAYTNFSLKLVDRTGCSGTALPVVSTGYLFWIDFRGVYIWDGMGKPIYCSRPIEYYFGPDGSLDKSKLNISWGYFHKKTNEIIWTISDSILGENRAAIKFDVRLSLPQVETTMQGRILEGTFVFDKTTFPLYAGASLYPSSDETVISGDDSGYVYKLQNGTVDGAAGGIDFTYQTKSLDLGLPFTTKRLHKIILWVEDSTDADIDVDLWFSYNTNDSQAKTQSQPISAQVTRAFWDLAYWDAADWDGNNRTYSPLVFNVYTSVGTEGEALTLRFRQQDANAPVSIAGFSLIYSLAGLRK